MENLTQIINHLEYVKHNNDIRLPPYSTWYPFHNSTYTNRYIPAHASTMGTDMCSMYFARLCRAGWGRKCYMSTNGIQQIN